MPEILTPCCPLCGEPPLWVFGGGTQAFCGNDDCNLLHRDPTVSRSENLQGADVVRFPPEQEDGGG